MIQKIEEASMNAWPALQTLLYDGWIIRFTNGYTRRANSINPLYPSTIDIDDKIRYCSKLYNDKKLRTIFKITEKVFPRDLDKILKHKNYHSEAETSVQIIKFISVDIDKVDSVEIIESLDDNWINQFITLNKINIKHKPTLTLMLNKIASPKCFVSIRHKSKIIACGMGVAEKDMIGLFDIVVDENFRRRGFGTALVHSILHWAKTYNAKTGYLQVMLENKDAVSLYKKIGFTEIYKYWYRVK